jgi:hypothetical protein
VGTFGIVGTHGFVGTLGTVGIPGTVGASGIPGVHGFVGRLVLAHTIVHGAGSGIREPLMMTPTVGVELIRIGAGVVR